MTAISDKMRALATTGHHRSEALVAAADKFDELSLGFYNDPQTVDVKRFMGSWARVRRLWCECSGEDLI